jgi:hypothetical protein
MGFWQRLFGGGLGKSTAHEDEILGEDSYKGFRILAVVMMNGAEYQLAGRIEKEIAGEMKSYRFVRADRFSGKSDVAALALSKGRQIIDEQGERIFS